MLHGHLQLTCHKILLLHISFLKRVLNPHKKKYAHPHTQEALFHENSPSDKLPQRAISRNCTARFHVVPSTLPFTFPAFPFSESFDFHLTDEKGWVERVKKYVRERVDKKIYSKRKGKKIKIDSLTLLNLLCYFQLLVQSY